MIYVFINDDEAEVKMHTIDKEDIRLSDLLDIGKQHIMNGLKSPVEISITRKQFYNLGTDKDFLFYYRGTDTRKNYLEFADIKLFFER